MIDQNVDLLWKGTEKEKRTGGIYEVIGYMLISYGIKACGKRQQVFWDLPCDVQGF